MSSLASPRREVVAETSARPATVLRFCIGKKKTFHRVTCGGSGQRLSLIRLCKIPSTGHRAFKKPIPLGKSTQQINELRLYAYRKKVSLGGGRELEPLGPSFSELRLYLKLCDLNRTQQGPRAYKNSNPQHLNSLTVKLDGERRRTTFIQTRTPNLGRNVGTIPTIESLRKCSASGFEKYRSV